MADNDSFRDARRRGARPFATDRAGCARPGRRRRRRLVVTTAGASPPTTRRSRPHHADSPQRWAARIIGVAREGQPDGPAGAVVPK